MVEEEEEEREEVQRREGKMFEEIEWEEKKSIYKEVFRPR